MNPQFGLDRLKLNELLSITQPINHETAGNYPQSNIRLFWKNYKKIPAEDESDASILNGEVTLESGDQEIDSETDVRTTQFTKNIVTQTRTQMFYTIHLFIHPTPESCQGTIKK
ncbi:hypothetical protein AVEN_206895-1 [Araneus ventricosus]|uniref:Uncharacterized protein n=1 Tax=Araneus ventricosus TaxID=182803 RepID=A0A4Y2BBD7_ARAVE|nr:hypothetical protein AVEN_206895-1 [Araneus ventricosus]